jgi:CubicO group peptidase (beta-lactamase class C family)
MLYLHRQSCNTWRNLTFTKLTLVTDPTMKTLFIHKINSPAKKNDRLTSFTVLILILFFSSGLSRPTFADCSNLPSRVDQVFDSFITSKTPGAAIAVVRDGRILYQSAYGLANLPKHLPMTTHNLFHFGSIGKQFTALAIMKLVEKGRLNYDDPIGKHIPELARFGSQVTIRRLLHHVSGMPFADDGWLLDLLLDMNPKPSNKNLIALLAKHGRLRFTPGDKFVYNNTGYDILGALIERVSGQTYPNFMRQHIFAPAGMKHTFSQPNPDRMQNPNIARSYIREDGYIVGYNSDPLDYIVGSGTIYSTVGDMALYDAALYTNLLVKQSTLAEAFKPTVLNSGIRVNYGFGWDMGRSNGRRYVGHEGYWLGFVSYYVRFLNERLGVIVAVNRDYGLPDANLAMKIANIYLNSGCLANP